MSTAERQRPAILVVEDDESLRELLCIVLEGEGYAPVGACDGRDALRQLDAGLRPALITLDLRMPVMDGWAFLSAYAAFGVGRSAFGGVVDAQPTSSPEDRTPNAERVQTPVHAPVLIITALAQNGHPLSRDVAGVVTKPFALDDLLARVRALAPLPDVA